MWLGGHIGTQWHNRRINTYLTSKSGSFDPLGAFNSGFKEEGVKGHLERHKLQLIRSTERLLKWLHWWGDYWKWQKTDTHPVGCPNVPKQSVCVWEWKKLVRCDFPLWTDNKRSCILADDPIKSPSSLSDSDKRQFVSVAISVQGWELFFFFYIPPSFF